MPIIHETPKEALQAYITHLETAYYKWYEASVRRNYVLWLCCQILALVAGFGTSVLAALLKQQLLSGGSGAWVVIILPFLGSIASTVVVQSRVYERWRLREEGRVAFQGLVTEGRRRFAGAASPAEYSDIHKCLGEEVARIEKEQSGAFFALSPSFIK